MRVAADQARAGGLRPLLDVAVQFDGAARLYDAAGWSCVGTVTTVFPNGDSLDEFVYVAPAHQHRGLREADGAVSPANALAHRRWRDRLRLSRPGAWP